MSKKYKCILTETYICEVEIPENADINDLDLSEAYDLELPSDTQETFIEIQRCRDE